MRSGWSDGKTHLSLGQKGLTSARQPRINGPSRPICSARYARKTRSRCRLRAACSFISTRSPPRSPPAATPFSIKPADMAQKDLRVPSSISLLPLSPRHAPSSTARKTSGSSCVRTGCRTASSNLFNDIVDHCCYAWNTLIDQSWKISSRFGRCRSLFVRTDIRAPRTMFEGTSSG
jgi:hypothetical protein